MMQWHLLQVKCHQILEELILYVSSKVNYKCTDPVEEQDEIESEGDEQGQEPQVVEVARKVVLWGVKHKSNILLPDKTR